MNEQTRNHASKLADQCAGIASNLSYNDKGIEGEAKHALRECSHFADSHAIRVHKKHDGILVANARGATRFLTWRERVALWLLDGRTEIRP